MNSERTIVFPNQLLEKMQIETTIFSPGNDALGVAALSEEVGLTLILRLYQLVVDEENVYQPLQELAAFSFKDRLELESFLDRIPEISGLEMLMLLNPLPGVGSAN